MDDNEFDRLYDEERKELADLEYSEPLTDQEIEIEEEPQECSCILDKELCPIHGDLQTDWGDDI